jgi:signal transduction histidine kinase
VKLRTQFMLLVTGILLIPVLVTLTSVLIHFALNDGQPYFLSFGLFSGLRRPDPGRAEERRIARTLQSRPPGTDMILLGGDNRVLQSTIPGFLPGEEVGVEELFRFTQQQSREYHFQFQVTPPGEGPPELMVLRVARDAPQPPAFLRSRLWLSWLTPSIALLAFSAVASFFIVRSQTNSIFRLERATRHIAQGELDFELPVKGNDEIASLTRSFDSMRHSLKEEYARRARFIMGVSHDLKTPLALIHGYLEAIEDGYAEDPATMKRYLQIVRQKAQGLESMIDGLIDFVKMDTGQWRSTLKETPLRGLLEEIGRRYAEDAVILRRSFRYAVEVPEELAVPMDRELVVRAFENILGNAIRYTGEAGAIEMTAAALPGEVRVEIRDTGIGIPEQDLPRIFDPFYRGTNSRREEGSGLGLATVKSVVESHGWRIEVASRPQEGTVFTIHIPTVGALPAGG